MYQLQRLEGKGGKVVRVIERVAGNWEKLAYALEFSSDVVKTIRRDCHYECEQACQEVLHRWISGAARQPVSWWTLVESLRRENDFGKLADDLEEALD